MADKVREALAEMGEAQPETAEDEVEAVARAICVAEEGCDPAFTGWNGYNGPRWHVYRETAKAAIAAMRVPPPETTN